MSQYDDHGYGDHDYVEHQTLGGTRQTRTRLPEGEGDPYPAGRRRSPSRNLAAVVGVVVLLVAAIAFANRDSDDEAASPGSEDRPAAGATAATGTKPVEGGGGIPSGFARDEQGAQSAAANYAVALGSAEMFEKPRRQAIAQAVYTPSEAAARQADLDKVYSDAEFLERIGLDKDGSAPSGSTFVSRTFPVGTKSTKHSSDAATVEVWYSSLFGLTGQSSKNPVTESWYTATYQLKWVEGDWKVTDFDQRDGPVPVGGDQRASTGEEMSKAVEEYGGFTYAR